MVGQLLQSIELAKQYKEVSSVFLLPRLTLIIMSPRSLLEQLTSLKWRLGMNMDTLYSQALLAY